MSRITVCHTINSYITGGIERTLELSVQPLRELGIDTVVLGWRDDHPNIHRLTDQGVPFYQIFDRDWRLRYSKRVDPQIMSQVGEIVKKHSVNIFHAHHPADPLVAHDLARETGLPYVISKHECYAFWQQPSGTWPRLFKILQKRAYSHAARLKCVSQPVLDVLTDELKWKLPNASVLEIMFDDSHREGSSAGSERIYDIAIVGRLADQKNVLFSVDVLAELRKSRPNLKVAILGVGPRYDDVEQRIKRLGLEDNLLLLGQQPPSVVFETLQQSKVFYAPSHFEGLSQAAVEALSQGLFAVVSTAPSFTKVFTNETGMWFCDPTNLQENVEALDTALRTFEPTARPELVSRFSRERYCGNWAEVYREVVAEHCAHTDKRIHKAS